MSACKALTYAHLFLQLEGELVGAIFVGHVLLALFLDVLVFLCFLNLLIKLANEVLLHHKQFLDNFELFLGQTLYPGVQLLNALVCAADARLLQVGGLSPVLTEYVFFEGVAL